MKKGISTGKGDKGFTFVPSVGRVEKSNELLDAVGVLDELSSFISLAKVGLDEKKYIDLLNSIQEDLIKLGGEIALGKKAEKRILDKDVIKIEKNIEELELKVRLDGEFKVLGNNEISAYVNIARTLCRRFERKAVFIYEKGYLKNELALKYINRLSDLLFLITVYYDQKGYSDEH